MIRPRLPIAALVLSASALVGIATHEGYVDTATPPVKGDVPTNGFGSTGPDIKLGDKTDPVRAIIRLERDASQYADAVKRCAPVPMYQHEFNAYVSLAYNIGPTAFCNSTLRNKLVALDYDGACKQILRWDRFHGKPLAGLTKRRRAEYQQCIGETS